MKMFLIAITGAYVSKTLSGTYMNSMLTQIERQFNIPTSVVGIINGSFEIGNLLLIVFVSYFGTKLHRPIMIGVGCVVMGLGCFLISLPHFLMGRYQLLERFSNPKWGALNTDCVKEMKSLMWIYVLVGNIIRGMGETPIMPLGISYIEDFAKSENSPLYIGIIETGAVLGPLIGLFLGSFCANIYVDTGSVNIDDLTITPTDTRWVGAWWIGFLICAGVNVLTGIPFFFLPKTLPKEGQEDDADAIKNDKDEKHRKSSRRKNEESLKANFLPFMKSLSCNPIYMLFTLISVMQFNAFINMFSFMPKYLEQQYGKSTSEAIFLIGLYNLPPICIGYIIGGLIMKKFKITVKQGAHIACWLALSEYFLYFLSFLMTCDNYPVAGLTTSYEGIHQPLSVENKILADCNTGCSCTTKTWDPVCGDNGLAYMSACLAGCENSVGAGVTMVFQNCSCIGASGNSSAVLGLCNKGQGCADMLQYFLIMAVVGSFVYSLAAIPGYMVLLSWNPSTDLLRALIDSTCLHWGTLKCGEPGACRMYDINNFSTPRIKLSSSLLGSDTYEEAPPTREVAPVETEFVETKLTEKENEFKDGHRNSKVENNEELKTKL